MDHLVENVQQILDNPIKKIDWDKIYLEFSKLLKQDIEYDDEEIQYIERKLEFPEDVDMTSVFVIADELLTNYKIDQSIMSEMVYFEHDNPELVGFLKTLSFPTVNNHVLRYQTDHWFLMDEFEKLLQKGIEYHMDDIKNWLSFNKSIMIDSCLGTGSFLMSSITFSVVSLPNFAKANLSKLSSAPLQKSTVLVDFDLLNLFVRNLSLFLCTSRYPNSSIFSCSIIL